MIRSPEGTNRQHGQKPCDKKITNNGIDIVVRYIETQKEHHQQTSFQDELRQILKRNNIEFDERFVWD